MNITEFTSLLNHPNAIHDIQTISLEKIVQEFKYFQSARALYLKGLYNQNSFKYNYALKITAAHTTDRSVLFDFITSDTFTAINRTLYDKKASELLEIPVFESELITSTVPVLEQKLNTLEESILTSIKSASAGIENKNSDDNFVLNQEIVENNTQDSTIQNSTPLENNSVEIVNKEEQEEIISEKLDLGKPLEFSKSEKHSFKEWLQLSKLQEVVRTEVEKNDQENQFDVDIDKQKKNELINKFIETSPRISPIKHDGAPLTTMITELANTDNSSLMTETLARVYLEQKKYQKAIQAYQILILKYPEKNSFFADRILDIKKIQQNNIQQ